MKIGELSQRSGLTASRIRFYESSGLIQGIERKANGYRDYGPEVLWVLEIIAGAQSAGFSLDEIRRLLPTGIGSGVGTGAGQWQHGELVESLKRKVSDIGLLQKRLEQNKAQLLLVIESIEHGPEGMACEDRTQWVLARLRAEGLAPEQGP